MIELQTPTRLEQAGRSLNHLLATRTSRKSLLDRMGKSAIALTLGAAASGVFASTAKAHLGSTCGACQGSCCGSDSVWCETLTGSNACPGGTVGCGSWIAGTCAGGQTLRYADCCGDCGNGAYCQCVGGAPSCCRHQTYRNGSSDNCADNHIKCRRWFCS